ncbi:hypothetical protein ES707_08118 [subsurface metagenome]
MGDDLIESEFLQEVVDRSKRRIWGMVTRFGLKSQDSDVEKIDEDGPDDDGLSC